MELLLIRHARPESLVAAPGVQPDPELSPIGIAQAEVLAEALAAEPLAAVYCSTMQRARSTAAPLARRHGLVPHLEPDLVELTLGEQRYVPLDARRAGDQEQQDWLMDFAGRAGTPEGARAVRDFRDRVESAVARIGGAHQGEVVAVVCHGAVINVVLTAILGLDDLMTFHPDYASVSRVLLSRAGHRQVVSVNEHAHVVALERLHAADIAVPS